MDEKPTSTPIPTLTPPTAPAVEPTPPMTPPKEKKPKSKWIVGGIIAGAAVVLLGGSTFAYNLWYQNPDKVVHDAIVNIIEARTIASTGKVTFVSDDVTFTLDLDNKANSHEFMTSIKATIEATPAEGEKLSLKLDGSGIFKDDALYFKLDGVKEAIDEYAKMMAGTTDIAYLNTVVEKIDNKWISVKSSDYEEMGQEYSEMQTCVTDTTKRLAEDTAARREITDLYKKHQIVVVNEKLGSKRIEGTGSLGYTVGIDKQAAEDFVRNLGETTYGKEFKRCDETLDFGKAADDIAKETESTTDATVTAELWVSRFGHEVTQFSLAVKDDDASLDTVLNPVFNQAVTVDAPEDAIALKDLIEDIQAAMMQYYMEQYQGVEGV